MTLKKNMEGSGFGLFVGIACFVTVLSQLPVFVERGLTSRISALVWLVLFAVALIRCRGIIALTDGVRLLGAVALFAVYYCICVILNEDYARSDLPYVIALSSFVLITGTMVGRLIKYDDLITISKSFIFGCVILAAVVYVKFFRGMGHLSRIYLYGEKNSTAQILMTAVILILTVHLNDTQLKWKVAYVGALFFLSAMLLLMRSRATIIFIPVLVYLILVSKNLGKRLKLAAVLVVSALVLFLMLNDEYRNNLINDVLYAGRDSSDLNEISSGRVQEWETFLSDLGDNWLFGHGRMKRESLILVSILEYGVVCGSLILGIALYPLYFGLVKLPKDNPYRALLVCIAACYALNGVFEQLAPFGPGVKCFFLWFLLGILSCQDWKSLSIVTN